MFLLFDYALVNIKRSKSAPGLVETSCRLPLHGPVRRTGSEFRRLPFVKETNTTTVVPSIVPLNSFSNQEQEQPSTSSYSLIAVAPLASSVSVTSSLNSNRQQTINHSASWSLPEDAKQIDLLQIGRATSLINNDMQSYRNSVISNETERLRQRLTELEKQDLRLCSISNEEYIEIEKRKKVLEEKQLSGEK